MGKSSEKYLQFKEQYEAQRDREQIELAERLERLYEQRKAEYEHYYSEKATQRRAAITNALNKVFMDFHPLQFMKDE
jgi:methionyl-tRNA synthetase